MGLSKPSAWAVMKRSMGYVVPARAPEPRGHSLSRAAQSSSRVTSRRNWKA